MNPPAGSFLYTLLSPQKVNGLSQTLQLVLNAVASINQGSNSCKISRSGSIAEKPETTSTLNNPASGASLTKSQERGSFESELSEDSEKFIEISTEIQEGTGSAEGEAGTPSPTFLLYTYAPRAFERLRRYFGFEINNAEVDLKESVNVDNLNKDNSASNVILPPTLTTTYLSIPTSGRSGSLFFISSDNRYLLKTLPVSEYKTLQNFLPHYIRHFKEHPSSLLPRFLAMHR